MHKLYGWLTTAGIEPNIATLPKHLEVIDEYSPEADEVIAFARLFYGFGDRNDALLDKFGTAMQDADPSFLMEKHTQELSIFAGAALISLIERDQNDRLTDLAALCMVCGGAQGARTGVSVPEMPMIAARYVENRTSKRASTSAEALEDDLKFGKLERELTIVSEEVNMLWWLVSETSRDRKQSWKRVGLSATSIIAGKELADLTRVVPGPVAAAAFLDRIVRLSNSDKSAKPVKVKEAVETTPREWRDQYPSTPAELADLAPISNSIKLSLTVSEGDDWSPVFEKGTTLEADTKLPPTALAYQTFLERLLARSAGEPK
jgi:hypothetical protein